MNGVQTCARPSEGSPEAYRGGDSRATNWWDKDPMIQFSQAFGCEANRPIQPFEPTRLVKGSPEAYRGGDSRATNW